MAIRNKLLTLLLSASLIPLAVYFVLDVSFSRIVRNRVENSLRSALEERAGERLVETIDNYEKMLKMSAQAVRYGLHHYANRVQQTQGLVLSIFPICGMGLYLFILSIKIIPGSPLR